MAGDSDDESEGTAVFDSLVEVSKGLTQDPADLNTVLKRIKQNESIAASREVLSFIAKLVKEETPDAPDQIAQLEKNDLRFITLRVNFFEKIRVPAYDDEQLEHLYSRTQELWGEYPTEPIGRWVEWSLWTTLHRRRNGISITEIIAGDKSAEDLKQMWIERHTEREKRRELQKIDDYDRYSMPEDVPPSLRHVVMSPFIDEPTQYQEEGPAGGHSTGSETSTVSIDDS